MKKLKNKRGFSLVELMVVVAIMGTLAAIAIPAYNEYRKSAKKTAYRTDLLGLHKGWQAFGVELDSYCERDTSPDDASINNIGMGSLLSSKLYGISSASTMVQCSGYSPSSCNGIYNTGHDCTGGGTCTGGTASAPSGTGPGKHNFVGFGTENCTNVSNLDDVRILGDQAGTRTTNETRCVLNTTTYIMGVGGQLSGANYIGINVNENGVVDERGEDTAANVFNTSNANGVCA